MKNFLVWTIFVMMLSIHSVSAQSPSPPAGSYQRTVAWTKVTWDADRPYHQARRNIDAQIKAGVSLETLAQKLDQPMQLNDTLIQFKWAYANYEAARKMGFSGRKLQTIKERLQFGSEQKPPHSAEFARLLFLTYSRLGPFENLADAGQRLVKEFPDDFEVKWFTLKCLNPGMHPKQLPVALSYARDLKKRQPNKSGVDLLVPEIYLRVWYSTQTKRDGLRASNAFKVFLTKTPRNSSGRKFAQSQIKFIKSIQPILDKKKRGKLTAS